MKSLKLNNLEYSSLNEKEMNHVTGGGTCGCGCAYEGNGGSSTSDNGYANQSSGLWSDVPLEQMTIFLEEVIINP
ncbi:MAG: TIGR04149 family rSAM-modified RiPP [Bacteroidales bacterium]|jgi:natural product precursor